MSKKQSNIEKLLALLDSVSDQELKFMVDLAKAVQRERAKGYFSLRISDLKIENPEINFKDTTKGIKQ